MSKNAMQATAAADNSKISLKELWEQKADPDLSDKQKMLQTINFKLGNFDDENRSFKAIASTPMLDRQGDSIEQSGWVLDNFIKNPVIPWAHSYWDLPVARATEIGVVDGNLQMTVQFPPEEVYDFADTVWQMYRRGFMFAFSVGFIPIEYEGNWEDGYNFTKCELLEVSAVPVPANAGALVLAQKLGVMDNKHAKQMVSKIELALKNLKEASGMTEKQSTKKVEEKTDTSEFVKMSDLKDVLKELLAEKAVVVEEDAEDTSDTDEGGAKGLTNNDIVVQTDNMTEQKSGAKLSQDTKAKIKEVMDGLEDCMKSIQTHHSKLGELYNVGADSEDSDEVQNDDPEVRAVEDGVKLDGKPEADKAEVVGEVKSAENDSEDGADHKVEEEAKEDESKEDDSAEEEAKAVKTPEVKAVEEESKVEEVEDSEDEEDLVDPEDLNDEDVAKIAAAVQLELDKDNE